jgi:hypothetical protein
MQVEKLNDADFGLRLTLTHEEVDLLRTALERASFIDTPPNKQEATLSFCAKLLEVLGQL